MGVLIAFFRGALLDGSKSSFGRIVALPFLASSFSLLTVGGIVDLCSGEIPIESAATLATIGLSLFVGSKFMSIKGKGFSTSVGQAEPSYDPVAHADSQHAVRGDEG